LSFGHHAFPTVNINKALLNVEQYGFGRALTLVVAIAAAVLPDSWVYFSGHMKSYM
jgi:hypothetical protein